MNFYNVFSVFVLDNHDFCLLEQVIVGQCARYCLNGRSTEMRHTHKIVNLNSKNFVVKPIEFIIRQVSFVQLESELSETFNGELQYLIETEN